jgi:hypothetical protein
MTKDDLLDLVGEGYFGHFNAMDASLNDDSEANVCEKCGGVMRYRGLKKQESYRAFMVCSNENCNHVYEF